MSSDTTTTSSQAMSERVHELSEQARGESERVGELRREVDERRRRRQLNMKGVDEKDNVHHSTVTVSDDPQNTIPSPSTVKNTIHPTSTSFPVSAGVIHKINGNTSLAHFIGGSTRVNGPVLNRVRGNESEGMETDDLNRPTGTFLSRLVNVEGSNSGGGGRVAMPGMVKPVVSSGPSTSMDGPSDSHPSLTRLKGSSIVKDRLKWGEEQAKEKSGPPSSFSSPSPAAAISSNTGKVSSFSSPSPAPASSSTPSTPKPESSTSHVVISSKRNSVLDRWGRDTPDQGKTTSTAQSPSLPSATTTGNRILGVGDGPLRANSTPIVTSTASSIGATKPAIAKKPSLPPTLQQSREPESIAHAPSNSVLDGIQPVSVGLAKLDIAQLEQQSLPGDGKATSPQVQSSPSSFSSFNEPNRDDKPAAIQPTRSPNVSNAPSWNRPVPSPKPSLSTSTGLDRFGGPKAGNIPISVSPAPYAKSSPSPSSPKYSSSSSAFGSGAGSASRFQPSSTSFPVSLGLAPTHGRPTSLAHFMGGSQRVAGPVLNKVRPETMDGSGMETDDTTRPTETFLSKNKEELMKGLQGHAFNRGNTKGIAMPGMVKQPANTAVHEEKSNNPEDGAGDEDQRQASSLKSPQNDATLQPRHAASLPLPGTKLILPLPGQSASLDVESGMSATSTGERNFSPSVAIPTHPSSTSTASSVLSYSPRTRSPRPLPSPLSQAQSTFLQPDVVQPGQTHTHTASSASQPTRITPTTTTPPQRSESSESVPRALVDSEADNQNDDEDDGTKTVRQSAVKSGSSTSQEVEEPAEYVPPPLARKIKPTAMAISKEFASRNAASDIRAQMQSTTSSTYASLMAHSNARDTDAQAAREKAQAIMTKFSGEDSAKGSVGAMGGNTEDGLDWQNTVRNWSNPVRRAPVPPQEASTAHVPAKKATRVFTVPNPAIGPLPPVDMSVFNQNRTPPKPSRYLSVDVLSIRGNYAVTLKPAESGIFYSTELLCIVTRSKQGGLVETQLTIWRGKHSVPRLQDSEEEAKIDELKRRYRTSCTTVVQGCEGDALVHALGGRLVIRHGTRAAFDILNTTLYRVQSVPNDGVIIDEVDLQTSSLCSAYSYVASVYEDLFVWHGRGATQRERNAALHLTMELAQDSESGTRDISEIDEGNEPAFFREILGEGDYASANHWRFRRASGSPQSTHLYTVVADSVPIICYAGDQTLEHLPKDSIILIRAPLELYIIVPPNMRHDRTSIALALNVASRLSHRLQDAGAPFRPPMHALVMPSLVPCDLAACFRSSILQEANHMPGSFTMNTQPPSTMNVMDLETGQLHLARTTFEHEEVEDIDLLPLGIAPHMLS